MTDWRPSLRRTVMSGSEASINAVQWARTFGVDPESITQAVNEFVTEREAIEALRKREEAGD